MARYVGLEIGSERIRAVVVNVAGRSLTVEKIVTAPLPPDTRLEAGGEFLAKALQTLASHKIPRDRVIVTLPAELAVLRNLSLPFLRSEQLRKTVKFEAEGVLPFTADEVIVAFFRVFGSEDRTEVALAALRKDVLRNILGALEKAGIDPMAVELDISAAWRLVHLQEGFPKEGTALLVDLGSGATKVGVVEKGRLVALRAVRPGTAELVEEIRKALGGEATAGAAVEALRAGSPAIEEVSRRQAERAAREVQRFLASVTLSEAPSSVILVGDGAAWPAFRTELGRILGIPAAPAELPDVRGLPEDCPAAAVAAALGAAAAEESDTDIVLNFRQEEFEFRRRFDQVKTDAILISVLAGMLFLVLSVGLHRRARSLAGEERRIARENQGAFDESYPERKGKVRSSSDILVELELKRKELTGDAARAGQKYRSSLDILKEFTKIAPAFPPEKVKQIEVVVEGGDRQRLRAQLVFSDITAVDSLRAELANAGCFDTVTETHEPPKPEGVSVTLTATVKERE
ncbi:MAG: pilus assembly protein PilM [Planctomycetota bacterium]